MPRIFCFGVGYTARRLLGVLRQNGWEVAGTSRSPEQRATLASSVILAYDFPLQHAGATLEGTTHLLSSVPPDEDGDPVLRNHGPELSELGDVTWAGYLSTTGVYGDRAGDWVDETSVTAPTSVRGKRRLAAEAGWLELQRNGGLPVHVFRLAAIYGPGRSAIDAVREGRARRIAKPGQMFSRIHVDDIVQTLRASMQKPNPGSVYNLADDAPSPAHEVVEHACMLLGAEPPPLVELAEAQLSPAAMDFYADNKRVSNARLRRELGVTLRYPNYRRGLSAILRDADGRHSPRSEPMNGEPSGQEPSFAQ